MKQYTDLIDSFNAKKGKSTGIPGALHFEVLQDGLNGYTLSVQVAKNEGETGLRLVDPWLLAMAAELEALKGAKNLTSIEIELNHDPDQPSLTSFTRRISYLAVNNNWKACLKTPSGPVALIADLKTLLIPQAGEEPREGWGERTDNKDQDGAVEKMFQTWLAGSARMTNGRLAILGEDFMPGKRGEAKVEREVPTGSFHGQVSKNNYILPTYWIDLVTLNKWGQLALIELKVGDISLEVMAQALDYALFCRVHYDKFAKDLKGKLEASLKGDPDIVCYIVNNRYHPRFDGIKKYYQPQKSTTCGFCFKKVVLGVTTDF